MAQTAVEWVIEKMFKEGYFDGNKPLSYTNLDHLQQQALEMEEQQLLEFWNGGIDCESSNGKSFDQYYKQKFNKEL